MKNFHSRTPRNAKGSITTTPQRPSGKVTQKKRGPSPIPTQAPGTFPMRINKYLAMKGHATRRDADLIIAKGLVIINGRIAKLGDKVNETDIVEVFRKNAHLHTQDAKNADVKATTNAVATGILPPSYVYYAYNKPAGVNLETVARSLPLQGVFPVVSLDREAEGLVILTNDRRIIDRLNTTPQATAAGTMSVAATHVAPNAHMKEYLIHTIHDLKHNFKEKMEKGVVLAGTGKNARGKHPITIDCSVHVIKKNIFTLRTTDSGSHIRHICSLFFAEIKSLARTKIGTIALGGISVGQYRPIVREELVIFLKELGL